MALPMAVLFGYIVWLGQFGDGVQAGSAARSNALIAACIDDELGAERSGTACIGRFATPCQARADMQAPSEQIECSQREFVLWKQRMDLDLKALLDTLGDEAKRAALEKSQELWRDYHVESCRLAYQFYDHRAMAEPIGSWCSLRLTAYRSLELAAWRRRLAKG